MKKITFLLVLSTIFLSLNIVTFKDEQKKYSRVRQAYKDKAEKINTQLKNKSIKIAKLNVYIQIFKTEGVLELWGKNNTDGQFKLIREFDICESSGVIGPKREEGDLQVPEGFYSVNHFNPYSNFYLSLGIDYPNKSDRILGTKGNLGGAIYIDGNCVTIGCVPITDPEIKELYLYCVEAKNNGQNSIPVTIFPTKLSNANFNILKEKYKGDSDKINLWTDLKKGYDGFNKTKKLPQVSFLQNGRHEIK